MLFCRKDLINKLTTDLKASSPIPVDYTLLHEGGCTCDDTELPHHLSSNTQISVLVDCVQDILSHLKKPTLVTVARFVLFRVLVLFADTLTI